MNDQIEKPKIKKPPMPLRRLIVKCLVVIAIVEAITVGMCFWIFKEQALQYVNVPNEVLKIVIIGLLALVQGDSDSKDVKEMNGSG